MDAARDAEAAAKAARPNLFAKPSIDDMGPGTDSVTPAGAVSRSLFKKQTAAEAHGSDYGLPEDAPKLFRKNSLDEMTVRRTEKPVPGTLPAKPSSSPLAGEDSSPRKAEPSGNANLVRGDDDPRPLVRARSGAGSYEDPRDTGRQKKRTGKTGRPGR
jgi:excinuclease ABC subunit B